jgi:hypothetical protein
VLLDGLLAFGAVVWLVVTIIAIICRRIPLARYALIAWLIYAAVNLGWREHVYLQARAAHLALVHAHHLHALQLAAHPLRR